MTAKFFGEFLQTQGLIDKKVLERVLKIQQSCNLKLGELAMRQGYLTEEDVLEINVRQQVEDKKFGDLAEELGFLEHEQLEKLLELQKQQHKFFGDVLIDLGLLTENQLDTQLESHQQQKDQVEQSLNDRLKYHPLGIYLQALIETTNRLFLRTLHQQSKFSQLITDPKKLSSLSVACQITLPSDKPFAISMLTNPETATIIAHEFTLMPLEECDLQFSADAFGEFLNIIIGQLIEDPDLDIPALRSSTNLDINIDEVCGNAEELLIAEIDTQIGDVFLLISD